MHFADTKFSFHFDIPDGWRAARGLLGTLGNLAFGRRAKLVHPDGSYIWIRVFDPRGPVDYWAARKAHVVYFDQNRHLLRSASNDLTHNDLHFNQIVYKNHNTGAECCSIHFTNGRHIFAIELAAVSWASLQAALPALDIIMNTWRFA